jgi:ferredoxin-thioredoxin reductase catalytic chain
MNEVDKFYETLRKLREPKGCYFNKDRKRVNDLLAGLLENKNRYGYMCCPCGLSSGEQTKDQEIICPCVYRVPDVKEFGRSPCRSIAGRRRA